MPVLTSAISPASDAFRANAERTKAPVAIRRLGSRLFIALFLALGLIGSPEEATPQSNTHATNIGELRAEVARRLRSVEGILKVSLNPKDRAVIFVRSKTIA